MISAMTRRALLLSAVSSAILSRVAFAAEVADVIYYGGPILTMDDANPRVEAVAVKGGRILAAGSTADVMSFKGSSTRLVDLEGRTMLPGFVDPHGHVMIGGLQAMSANVLPPPDGPNSDIATIQQTLRDWLEVNMEVVKGANLIMGFGYDNSQLKELRAPTKEELDAVSRDIPVLIVHQSAHIAVLNSKALEVAGYYSRYKGPGRWHHPPHRGRPGAQWRGRGDPPSLAPFPSCSGTSAPWASSHLPRLERSSGPPSATRRLKRDARCLEPPR